MVSSSARSSSPQPISSAMHCFSRSSLSFDAVCTKYSRSSRLRFPLPCTKAVQRTA